MRTAAISIGTLLSILGAGAGAVIWIMSYVASTIAPIQAQADINASQIQGVNESLIEANTKLDFLLNKYGGIYNPLTDEVTTKK